MFWSSSSIVCLFVINAIFYPPVDKRLQKLIIKYAIMKLLQQKELRFRQNSVLFFFGSRLKILIYVIVMYTHTFTIKPVQFL